MIIIGAKGFAKELLEIIHQKNELIGLAFYDDVNDNSPDFLYTKFPILKNEAQVKEHFLRYGNEFTIGIGGPILRKKIYDKFTDIGGVITSTNSKHSEIGTYETVIGKGCNLLSGAVLSNSVSVGMANIIYYKVIITHDVKTGDYVELSPGVKLLGRCTIGDFSTIGCNAVILPDVKVGNNVIIGAGAVVTKNIPDNCVAVGVPAKILKSNNGRFS